MKKSRAFARLSITVSPSNGPQSDQKPQNLKPPSDLSQARRTGASAIESVLRTEVTG